MEPPIYLYFGWEQEDAIAADERDRLSLFEATTDHDVSAKEARQALVHARGDLALLVSHVSGIHKAAHRLQSAAEGVIVLLGLILAALGCILLALWMN